MKIQSGSTTNYIYFVAVDSTDLKTRETGLTTFTVYRSRNGEAASVMTTPTINEVDATNLPGVYELLLDEDTTATLDNEEMVFHITQASMAPVTRTIEIETDVLTRQMTEAYAADGVAPTLTQSLMLIQQVLTEFGIVGTALTIDKLDGSTTAAVLTLDDATTPTAATRSA
tara:strand:+ start:2443 stop:2955 length:513 start_codon:yes stop_codon:yes gene_type:complete